MPTPEREALAAEHKQLLMRLEYDLPSIRQQAEEYDPTRANSHLARVNPKFLLQVCELARAALSAPAPQVLPTDPSPEIIGALAVIQATMTINGRPTLGMGGAEEAYEIMRRAALQGATGEVQK